MMHNMTQLPEALFHLVHNFPLTLDLTFRFLHNFYNYPIIAKVMLQKVGSCFWTITFPKSYPGCGALDDLLAGNVTINSTATVNTTLCQAETNAVFTNTDSPTPRPTLVPTAPTIQPSKNPSRQPTKGLTPTSAPTSPDADCGKVIIKAFIRPNK